MEAAGPVCVAISKRRKQHGWLHETSLSALTWLFRLRYFEPDQLFKENVLQSDEAVYDAELCKDDVAKCAQCGRSLDEASCYTSCSIVVFSPSDVGCPAGRRRMYSRWGLRPFDRTTSLAPFMDLFGRTLATDLSIFFAVAQQVHEKELAL